MILQAHCLTIVGTNGFLAIYCARPTLCDSPLFQHPASLASRMTDPTACMKASNRSLLTAGKCKNTFCPG